jgi:hypothetical protein
MSAAGGGSRPLFIRTRQQIKLNLEPATFMPNTEKKATHKLGANRKETAQNPRPHDNNFKQSRDIHEDRGERQIKESSGPRHFDHIPRAK